MARPVQAGRKRELELIGADGQCLSLAVLGQLSWCGAAGRLTGFASSAGSAAVPGDET